jgi:hypothetical protein
MMMMILILTLTLDARWLQARLCRLPHEHPHSLRWQAISWHNVSK